MESIKYGFKVDIYKGLSAKDAYEELLSIRRKNNGELSPELVVEASQEESSVLHNIFEWDNEKAALKWRIEQARQLIKNITVTITTEECTSTYRAVVNVVKKESSERTYQPLPEVLKDDSAYQDLLAQAKEEAQSFLEKFSQLTELNGIKREMLKVINGVYPEE